MPLKRSQGTRLLTVKTGLDENELLPVRLLLREELGRPFAGEAEFVSENKSIKFDDVVGHPMVFRVALGDGGERFIHGLVSRFVREGEIWEDEKLLSKYRATIVPWLWFLTRTTDCRIYQEQAIPDIIKDVFQRMGFPDFELRLSATYNPKEYQVQYRETAFNFVSRLMESEGISYYFRHENGKHTLVMADSPSAYEALECAEIEYDPTARDRTEDNERVRSWSVEQVVQPTKVVLEDFDFKAPTKELKKDYKIDRAHAQAMLEVFDYPGEYTETGDGETYAKIRTEELQASFEVATGSCNARALAAGGKFCLAKHPNDEYNTEWLVVSAQHRFESDGFGSGGGGGDAYSCQFTAVRADVPFRPARTTPKPSIAGPQTAIVTTQSGDEITTDEFGRVKIKFHWDRHGKDDETSSCWVRVSQAYAGASWGSMMIPRKDQEVIVEFLEGDPDRPIITGRVYNGQATVPYKLPDNKNTSGFKSNSTKGGGGFNEISMDDTKGKEKVTIHAQYDMSTEVQHDQTNTVHNNRTTTIDVDDTETVTGKQTITVTGDQTITLEAKQTIEVTGDKTETLKAKQTTDITGDDTLTVKGKQTIGVTGEIAITSDTKITLTVGGSTIEIGPAEIKISSTTIKLGAPTIEITADTQLKAKGAMAELKADGMLTLEAGGITTIKGSILKLN